MWSRFTRFEVSTIWHNGNLFLCALCICGKLDLNLYEWKTLLSQYNWVSYESDILRSAKRGFSLGCMDTDIDMGIGTTR